MHGLKEQRPDTFSCCFASETDTTLENGELIVHVYFARTVKVGEQKTKSGHYIMTLVPSHFTGSLYRVCMRERG